jgi:hypothetical protein
MNRRTFLGACCTVSCLPRLYTSAAYRTLPELGADVQGIGDASQALLHAYAWLERGGKVIATPGVYRIGNGWVVQHAATRLSTTLELVAWAGIQGLRV